LPVTQTAHVVEAIEFIDHDDELFDGIRARARRRMPAAIAEFVFQLFVRDHAVERGEDPPGVKPASYRNVRAVDTVIPAGVDWREALSNELMAQW
jgi:hypothetical protein